MEFSFEPLIRENIKKLKAYSCARDEYQGEGAVLLDANENPYENGYNRYPDPHQRKLKAVLSRVKGVPEKNMVLGNGSDEMIDLLIRSVCRPGVDNVIVFSPGYSMYEISACLNDVEVRKINLTDFFQPDWETLKSRTDERTKIVFLCTPNNPVGSVIPAAEIESLCRTFGGLVLVDEAYIDFSEEESLVGLLPRCRNLVILQTLSKAWGMAGLRLGMCFADEVLVEVLNRIKAPYNISCLTQQIAVEQLQGAAQFTAVLLQIKRERERLFRTFTQGGYFSVVYPSAGNFLLVTTDKYRQLYDYLVAHGIVVRMRDIPPLVSGGLRISIGTEEENDRLIGLVERFFGV